MSSKARGESSQLPELVVLVLLLGAAAWLVLTPRSEPLPSAEEPPAQATEAKPPGAAASGPKLPGAAGEIQLIRSARRALRRGDAETALSTLAGYERAFPEGVMQDEVALVRIEAHVRRGDSAKAAAIAGPLLRKNPSSPQAKRARALITSTSNVAR